MSSSSSVGGALPSARTFDLTVRLKSDTDHPVIFSALNKEELQSIEDFLKMKKIRVKNEVDEAMAAEVAALGDSDDDDDDSDNDKMDVDAPRRAAGLLGEEDDEDSEGKTRDSFQSFELALTPLYRLFVVDEDFAASSGDESSSGDDSDEAMSDAGSEGSKPAKKKQKTSDE